MECVIDILGFFPDDATDLTQEMARRVAQECSDANNREHRVEGPPGADDETRAYADDGSDHGQPAEEASGADGEPQGEADHDDAPGELVCDSRRGRHY